MEISLRWNREEDRLVVVVDDHATEEVFELTARHDNALEVYYHPFAYMAAPRAA